MFYYKKGNVICRIPWNKPSIKVFNKWLDEFKQIPGVNDYDLHLTGAFCQIYFLNKEIDTSDLDMFLISKPNINMDYVVLKNILEESLRIGFKHQLLIDICWAENTWSWLTNAQAHERNTCSNKRICAHKEIITKTNNEFSHTINTSADHFREIIPGLYLSNVDPRIAYNKFIYKVKNLGYELPCKKLDI